MWVTVNVTELCTVYFQCRGQRRNVNAKLTRGFGIAWHQCQQTQETGPPTMTAIDNLKDIDITWISYRWKPLFKKTHFVDDECPPPVSTTFCARARSHTALPRTLPHRPYAILLLRIPTTNYLQFRNTYAFIWKIQTIVM